MLFARIVLSVERVRKFIARAALLRTLALWMLLGKRPTGQTRQR
jgi:hypothetical protein